MSPVIVPKEPSSTKTKTRTTSLRLTEEMLKELDAVASETGRSRNDVAVQLLRFGLDAHRAEGKKKR